MKALRKENRPEIDFTESLRFHFVSVVRTQRSAFKFRRSSSIRAMFVLQRDTRIVRNKEKCQW